MNEIINRSEQKEYSLNNSCDVVQLNDKERQHCEIWTRCMGYFRPVDNFNIGKKQEFKERVYFNQRKA